MCLERIYKYQKIEKAGMEIQWGIRPVIQVDSKYKEKSAA